MTAYYNEIDEYAAQWLRNLISAGHIAPGEVDTRSISEVSPSDLDGFDQCHFFAGIGGWSLAARLAGWPDDRPLWTGSCPCQPFSAAGKRGGFDDERHLWPVFHRLIAECRPAVVMGEQVASKDGLAWLDAVHADLQASGYACGAVDWCAAGVGSPHIRQRLWWVGERVADARDAGWEGWLSGRQNQGREDQHRRTGRDGAIGGLADATSEQCDEGWVGTEGKQPGSIVGSSRHSSAFGAATEQGGSSGAGGTWRPRPTNGVWRNADWLFCRDGKWRPVEPGTFPLAHGVPGRVGRLRAYGNAISPPLCAEVMAAYMETRP